MGKRKYQAVRVALSMKKSEKEKEKRSSISIMPKCPIPKLLTYNNLVRESLIYTTSYRPTIYFYKQKRDRRGQIKTKLNKEQTLT